LNRLNLLKIKLTDKIGAAIERSRSALSNANIFAAEFNDTIDGP